MAEKNRLPVQDLLLVRNKLNDAARKSQLRLIRFLTSKGVYRWGRPVDWTNQIVRAVCEEFGWSEYAEPLIEEREDNSLKDKFQQLRPWPNFNEWLSIRRVSFREPHRSEIHT